MSPPFGGESSWSLSSRQAIRPSGRRPPNVAQLPEARRAGNLAVELDQVAEFLVEPGRGEPPPPVEEFHVRPRLPGNRHLGRQTLVPYERVGFFRERRDAEAPAE